MKHNIHSFIVLFAMMFAAAGAQAQDADKIHAEDGLFNHLSVGLNTGTSGFGVDVAMPVHKLVTVRATSTPNPEVPVFRPTERWLNKPSSACILSTS